VIIKEKGFEGFEVDSRGSGYGISRPAKLVENDAAAWNVIPEDWSSYLRNSEA
jgi:hypothetical protein